MRSSPRPLPAPKSCSRGSLARRPGGVACGVLFGLLVGCSTAKSPPKLPIVAAPAVAVPAPPVPSDPAMFGYLKVGDLQGLIRRIGGEQAEQLAKGRGLNLSELQPGAPLVAFLWDPQGATPLEAPAVVLAPVPADGGMVGMLKTTTPAVRVAAVGTAMTAITLGEAAQERVKTGGPELVALAQAKAPFDAMIYVNATPILAKYGPMMRAGIAAMEPMLAMAAAKNSATAAPSAKSTMAMFEQMMTGLEDLKSITLGSTVTSTALELSAITTTKTSEGSPGPIAAPDLAQFVPPGDVKMQWNTRDFKKLIDWYLRMYGGFLAEKPELKAQIDQVIADWLKAGRAMETAFSMSFRSGQGLTMQGVMRVEDGPAALAAIRRSVKLFQTGPVHDLYKSMGIELNISVKQNVRKLKGHPVDRFEYSLKTNPDQKGLDPAVKTMLAKMSGLSYELAQVGPYLVYGLGVPVEPMGEALLSGQGAYPMAAMRTFPAGGTLYLEIDIAQILEWVRAFMPANSGVKIPTLPPQGSVVSIWSYDSGATSYQKTVIPMQLIKSIAAAAR